MLKLFEPVGTVITLLFPVRRSRVTLVCGSTLPFHLLKSRSLRSPRTFLVVVKHNVMKNPVKYCVQKYNILKLNGSNMHDSLTV